MADCPPGRSTSWGDRCETYSATTCIPRGPTDVGGVDLCQPVFLFGLPQCLQESKALDQQLCMGSNFS